MLVRNGQVVSLAVIRSGADLVYSDDTDNGIDDAFGSC